MTTIAWDGTILSGDSRGCRGTLPREVRKVFLLDDGRLFGFAGSTQDGMAALNYMNGNQKEKPSLDEDFCGIVIKDKECYGLECKLIPMPVEEKHYAIGSGREIALTAMYLGKTANEAVEIAKLFDVSTGGTVVSIFANGKEPLLRDPKLKAL